MYMETASADFDINGIILLAENPAFKVKAPYDIVLSGKPMHKWVELAFKDTPVTYLPYDGGDVPELVKNYLGNGEYTAVLYSDTPLFQRKSLLEILKYVKDNDLNVCRLTRGWVFRTEFLRRSERIIAPKTYYFEEEDFITASDFKTAALIGEMLRSRILSYHMANGVQITDTSTVYIDGDVLIAPGAIIHNNNNLCGKTVIESGVTLKPGNTVTDSVVMSGATLTSSNLNSCKIGPGTTVGPYAYIRPGSVIGEGCRIGDFVEIKNSRIGGHCKVSHLAYVGDCEMGEDCNIGCGTVFVNYDGKNKFKSVLGDRVFVGSNSNIIAPVRLNSDCFIAAGSTITNEVPAGSLAIARERQIIKTNWKRK